MHCAPVNVEKFRFTPKSVIMSAVCGNVDKWLWTCQQLFPNPVNVLWQYALMKLLCQRVAHQASWFSSVSWLVWDNWMSVLTGKVGWLWNWIEERIKRIRVLYLWKDITIYGSVSATADCSAALREKSQQLLAHYHTQIKHFLYLPLTTPFWSSESDGKRGRFVTFVKYRSILNMPLTGRVT